ncbi:protein YgfX [Methylobacter sp. sgz302048]|uniref:protein YgfX n=1 Tax=Methylobacter sp. sgz302048 TaxID=3455945 RepID=UPI003F9F938F
MSKKYDPSLLLELKPSKRLKQLLIFAHVLALGACLAAALPLAIKLALLAGIGLHCWGVIRRLNDFRQIIRYTEASGWEILDGDDFEPVRVINSTVITVYVIFLQVIRQNAGKKTIIVLNDALSEDDYRFLIVKLRTSVNTG